MRRSCSVRQNPVPTNIYCEYTYGKYKKESFQLMEKYLPYLNPETGLYNRMILRDPVAGLGELQQEWNPLTGCHLNRKSQPQRDPIKMQGELGVEYNCLFTTKELKCKPREFRNPVTLEGEFGEELDTLRPHGGRPRNYNNKQPMRNPISGVGDFGREWDPIYKYSGRLKINRPGPVRTDPITHTIPEQKLVRSQSMRHYNEAWGTRDPIGYMKPTDKPKIVDRFRGMRHFSQQNNDPITHRYSTTTQSLKIRTTSGNFRQRPSFSFVQETEHFTTSETNQNESDTIPYTHGSPTGDEISQIQNEKQRSQTRGMRNPITGEGMVEEDYLDLLKLPSDYLFRNIHSSVTVNQTTNRSNKSTPITKPSIEVNKPKPTKKRIDKSPQQETKEPQPTVKKVIRPKTSISVNNNTVAPPESKVNLNQNIVTSPANVISSENTVNLPEDIVTSPENLILPEVTKPELRNVEDTNDNSLPE